jgi:hypothetical protein
MASEGLLQMSAFLCDATRVIEAIAADCAVPLQGEASKMEKALGRWKQRNQSAAAALQKQCAGRIQELAKTAGDAAEMHARVDELNDATIAARTSASRAKKVAQCTELLRGLDETALDLKPFE